MIDTIDTIHRAYRCFRAQRFIEQLDVCILRSGQLAYRMNLTLVKDAKQTTYANRAQHEYFVSTTMHSMPLWQRVTDVTLCSFIQSVSTAMNRSASFYTMT